MASMRWVRPDLTTRANSTDFASKVDASRARPGSKASVIACTAAMWIEDGNTSFDDWEAFTSSLG